jgi:hypothetical protein
VSWTRGAEGLNVAVTEALAVRVRLHVPVPLQAPDHPAKVEVALGVAVSVTEVPLAKLAPHVAPQLMPAGLPVIVPPPEPALWTVSCTETGGGVGLALVDPQPQRAQHSSAGLQRPQTAFILDINPHRVHSSFFEQVSTVESISTNVSGLVW